MKRLAIPALILGAALAVGCEQHNPTALEPMEAAFNKKPPKDDSGGGSVTSECGGKTDLLDSRIDLAWAAVEGSGVGPDRDALYEGGVNGVHGKIFYHDRGCSRSFDAVFDPDLNSSSDPRKLMFHFPAGYGLPTGGVASGPFVNFTGLMRLGSDINVVGTSDSRDAKIEEKNAGAPRAWEFPATVAYRPGYPDYGTAGATDFRFNTDIKGCERLVYDEIRLERTGGSEGYAGVGTPVDGKYEFGQWDHTVMGSWTVESEPGSGHMAQCFGKQGKQWVEGPTMSMPFKVTITERRP
jgi:hypothetical protein